MTCTDVTRSWRSVSCPVAAMRWPSSVCSVYGSGGATRFTAVERFLRNPDRQLRDLGASIPSVSVNRNPLLPLDSRQPVTVTVSGATESTDTDGGAALIGSYGPTPVAKSSLPSASSMAATAAAGEAASAIRVFSGVSTAAFAAEPPAPRGATPGATAIAAAAGVAAGTIV